MNKFDEQILVVDRETLFNFEKNVFNGFISIEEQKALEIFETLDRYQVKRRGDMEEDASYKQLISYCILEDEAGDILVYERLSGGGESRLHGLASIGVGGHMNDFDGEIEQVLVENAKRELAEEVGLESFSDGDLKLIGFINDDDNEVGRVHIGLVFKVKVPKANIHAKETDTLKIDWEEPNRLAQQHDFESWSKLIISNLYAPGY